MINKTLIFDEQVDGHHLEYIHHLYSAALNKEGTFLFLLSPDFKEVSSKLSWPKSKNTSFIYISDKENILLKNKSGISKSFLLCKILKKAVKRNQISNVFLISLMALMPFLPFFISRRTKVSGIVYLIYLYRWKNSSIITRLADSIKNLMFSKFEIFHEVFLLNDSIAPIFLNKKFKTKVFKYLPDPFMPISKLELKNLRPEIGVGDNKIVCLHFGALNERKGTLEILRSIIDTDKNIIDKFDFIFAGEVNKNIRDLFYVLLHEARKKAQIVVYDEHLKYSFIGSLCFSSDYLLIPYKNTEQSSGIIGYAAQFKIPVVGPKLGLLGKLIKRYNLGILIDDSSSDSLKYFFSNLDSYNFKGTSNYVTEKKVSLFCDKIFNN